MSDQTGWVLRRLDQVATRVAEKNRAGYDRVMTVSAEHGLVEQEKFFNKRVASKDLSGYWVVHPGDFVYNKSTSKDAPFGVVVRHEGDEPVVVTSLYFVFRPRAEVVNPAYLLRVCNGSAFFDSLRGMLREGARAHGLLNVRLGEFYSASVAVPPWGEQARIVAILDAIEKNLEALGDEMERLRTTLGSLNTSLLEGLSERAVLGDLAAARSGPSYSAADVSKEPEPGRLPVIGIPNTKQDGSLDLTEVSHVSGLPASVRTVSERSLILIRTNGNRGRIGNVYLPPAEAHGHAVSAFQFLMDASDPLDREFLFWVLNEPGMQARMSASSSGTTGLGNLAVKWLHAAEIPWSSDASERAKVVAQLNAVREGVATLAAELGRLRGVHASVLSGLLSQEIVADVAVDRFIKPEPSETGAA